jgi:hypothetical protein
MRGFPTYVYMGLTQKFMDLGIEGILSFLIYGFIQQSLNPPIPKSLNLAQIDIKCVKKNDLI